MSSLTVTQPPGRLEARDTCLISTVSAEFTAATSLKVELGALFLTVPIAKGVVVKVECYVGTTGARFELLSEGAVVQNKTDEAAFETTYRVERSRSSTQRVSPSLATTLGGREVELQVGAVEHAGGTSKTVDFRGRERLLAVTQIGDSGIRWSLRSHRGESAVADYLEGTVRLEASAKWSGPTSPTIALTAQPTDIRFFGPDGAVLSLVASLALWAKLRATGRPVPSRDVRRHEIHLSPEP